MNLTLERIFGDPDLNGPTPLQLKMSPDSRYVSYLKADEDNFERLNLWAFDTEKREHLLLVDSSEFASDRVLSDAEKARRERLRISHQGIVEYHWSPTGKAILFPIQGNLFLYELGYDKPVKQLTGSATFETDIRFSPNGLLIAFVREKNLFTINTKDGLERQHTTEGGGTISCGLADFIAQEEMHRYEGYWWAPDSTKIAFTWVDESPIEVSQRYEIDADNFGVFDQHYPYAGAHNATVKVGVLDLSDDSIYWYSPSPDPQSQDYEYVARVNWFKDSKKIAIQSQTRDQQLLQLESFEFEKDSNQSLLKETSESWINLTNNFTALKGGDFVWGSERTGFNHLYLYRSNGELITQLTDGDWVVTDIKAITSSHIFFEGFRDTPLEKHLYSVEIDSQEINRLTLTGTSHQTSLSSDANLFIDRFSSANQPPAVDLVRIDGEVIEQLEQNSLVEGHPFAPFVSIRGNHLFDTTQAEDGQTLHYRLIKPSTNRLEQNGLSPLLLTVYGGPGVQRVSNEWIPPWHHYMASQGYGLLQLDNRGTTNRGKAFESPIYRKLGEVEVADQLAGLTAVLEQQPFDPNRLAVFGHSYGGYMTLMLMMKSQQFKAGISVAPVTDWGLYDTHYTERYLAHPDSNTAGYQASSVFPYVESLTGKVLIIHGMADDNVLFSNSTKLYKALQDQNIDFEIMNYPGAKHGLVGRKTNLHRYSLMDRFLTRELEGDTK